MLTLTEYAGQWERSPDWDEARRKNAQEKLLPATWQLEKIMREDGVIFPENPKTLSGISGEKFGGFRPQACKIGAASSRHKDGLAVDRYDPDGSIDAWCMANSGPGGALEQCGIWIEHPDATDGWSHWQCVPPKSGRRVFRP